MSQVVDILVIAETGPQGPPGPSGTGGTGTGQALSQIVMTDTVDGVGYAMRLVDGQLVVVGVSNGEALSQLVMIEDGVSHILKLVGGQIQVVGTA